MTNDTTPTKDMVLTRIFDAPAEQVWKAWSESDLVKCWWGPHRFTAPVAEMDFREGGSSFVCMRSPEGQDFYNHWTYQRIVPVKEIEFILTWANKEGKRVDPTEIGFPPIFPKEVRHVILFKPVGKDQTELTVTEYGYASDQILELSRAGMIECLDKMAACLKREG